MFCPPSVHMLFESTKKNNTLVRHKFYFSLNIIVMHFYEETEKKPSIQNYLIHVVSNNTNTFHSVVVICY